MTVGELKDFLRKIDNDLNVYALLGSENPLNDGRGIERMVVIASDTDQVCEAVYLKVDL